MMRGLFLLLVIILECSTFVWMRPQVSDVTFRRIRMVRSSDPDMVDPVVIERLRVHSTVVYRYATTTVSSSVVNTENTPNQAKFSVLLPEAAFITGFVLEVGGKVYNSFVKERQKAQHLYQSAVEGGLTAGHLAVNARDSSHFLISVNLEGRGKATFNLTYEQLLGRKLGLYNHVVNLHLGQVVPDLSVAVHISENHPLTKLAVLPFHTGGQIYVNNNETVWDQVSVERPSKKKAVVRWAPSPELQSRLEVARGEGLAGQLIVRYDVDNHSPGGSVLMNEGYFVHFVAPSELPPLRKHVIFTLDVSGSMTGRKLQQVKEAITQILDDLDPADCFNIIEFSYAVTVWNLDSLSSSAVIQPELHSSGLWWYNKAEQPPSTPPPPRQPPPLAPPYPATPEYVRKAKDVVEKMTAGGGTNIHGALKTAMFVAAASSVNSSANSTTANPEPIVIFLTDGDPTIGITDPTKILSMVKELNVRQSAIFSLAFGDGADLSLLRRLSLANNGFARNIYEAADAALQLRNFFREVASPLLANVTFSYLPGQVVRSSVTSQHFHTLFLGSQLVVAGRLDKTDKLEARVTAVTGDGSKEYTAQTETEPIDELSADLYGHGSGEDDGEENKEKKRKKKKKKGTLERLWAFLTIQQLLEKKQVLETEDVKKRVLELALKYNFVTPMTSLVVIKPNQSVEIDQDSLKPHSMKTRIYTGLLLQNKRPSPTKIQFEGTSSFMEESTTNKLIALEAWRTRNLTLSDLRWLDGLVDRDNATVTLPLGVNGTNQQYRLGLDQEDWPMGECSNPQTQVAGASHCRHLPHCVLPDILASVTSYIRYYCPLPNGYAGICCPDHRVSTTTERVETTTGDTDTTTIEQTTQV